MRWNRIILLSSAKKENYSSDCSNMKKGWHSLYAVGWGGKQSSYRSTLWSAEFLYSSFYNLCLLFSTCPVKTSFYSASWTILGQPMATKNSHSEEGLQLVTVISALILAGMYCPELQWHSVVSDASLCYSWGTCQCKQCRVYSDIPVTDVMQPILQVYMLEWSTSSMNPQFT